MTSGALALSVMFAGFSSILLFSRLHTGSVFFRCLVGAMRAGEKLGENAISRSFGDYDTAFFSACESASVALR